MILYPSQNAWRARQTAGQAWKKKGNQQPSAEFGGVKLLETNGGERVVKKQTVEQHKKMGDREKKKRDTARNRLGAELPKPRTLRKTQPGAGRGPQTAHVGVV